MTNENGEAHILPPPEQADEGKTEMVIKAANGQVVVRFREPRLWVTFDPPNAVEVGKHLIDCAVECGTNVTIEVPRRKISLEQRDRLIARASHILHSLQEKGRPPKDMARSVVDSILSAID